MTKFTLSIKWFFIVVIVLLVTGISLSNYLLSYYFYKKYLIHHTETVFSLFKIETEKITKPVETFLYNIQALVCCRILDFNDVERTNKFLMEFMNKYPYVTSINYGDGKGNGYLILNDRGRWLNRIKKAEEKGNVIWYTMDRDGKIIRGKKVKDDYDPRNTVWYKQAVNARDIQWSQEYLFRTTKDPGITASLMLCSDSREVVGVDMMIKDISLVMDRAKKNLHPEAKLYLISDNEYVIAFSDEIKPERNKIYTLNEKDFPLLYRVFVLMHKKDGNSSDFGFQGQKWFLKIENWRLGERTLSLVILIPQAVITYSLRLNIFYQWLISLVLMFLVLVYITRKYTSPLIDISRKVAEICATPQIEKYMEKYNERTDEIGILSRAIADASQHVMKAKELERRILEMELFDSLRRTLDKAVHRFKDLINIIHGFATIAQTKVSDEFVKNALNQIINTSERAIYLTKEILTVTGERKYEIKPVDLNSLIFSMKTKIESTLPESIKLVFEISEKILPVRLDIKAFDEVVMNLVSNAKDAMKDGGRLKIKTATIFYLDKEYACLSISDTGTGMDEETKKKIFEPFFTTKGAKGTGLGLSIVYKIIKDHEGFIDVESEPSKGTTFNIYFPLQQA